MKKWLVMTVCLCLAAACAPESDVEALKSELMEADTAFARMAFEEGRNVAFLEFMDEDVTIMPRRGELIRGKKKYREQLSESGAEEPVVRWKPFFADVSKSGDLGYTMGTFQYFENRQEDAAVLREGSYVTIWKKQPDGRWKFVFDAGNDKE
jgi:ketosteroid isomerase-like protein